MKSGLKKNLILGAAIAQWIRLRLPSCPPGFESQAHHLFIVKFCTVFVIALRKGRKLRKKPIFKKSN